MGGAAKRRGNGGGVALSSNNSSSNNNNPSSSALAKIYQDARGRGGSDDDEDEEDGEYRPGSTTYTPSPSKRNKRTSVTPPSGTSGGVDGMSPSPPRTTVPKRKKTSHGRKRRVGGGDFRDESNMVPAFVTPPEDRICSFCQATTTP